MLATSKPRIPDMTEVVSLPVLMLIKELLSLNAIVAVLSGHFSIGTCNHLEKVQF